MVEEALALQQIKIAPERAERIAAAMRAAIAEAVRSGPPLAFEIDATSHALILQRCKAQPPRRA